MTEAIFTEDDCIWRVEVVSDNSDKKWEKYQLKILEIVQPSQIFPPREVGYEFEASVQRRYSYLHIWDLELIE